MAQSITFSNAGAAALSIDSAEEDLESTLQIARLELPEAPTVLLVEDDPLVMERLKMLVLAAGYPVQTATSGNEALEVLASSPASIVVTDLNMPGMNGLQLCRSIRQQGRLGYVYIVLLTVQDNEPDVLSGLAAGADDYLSKRTSPAHLTARLGIAKRVLALEYSLTKAIERKHRLAMTDPLTGVFNRRYFTRHLAQEVTRAAREGSPLSLLILDVDRFKSINDTYGHGVGDLVLQTLTQTIRHCLKRTTDWCARLGGEEFAVVLEATDLPSAATFAEKIRQAIARSVSKTPAGNIAVTVSIGISTADKSHDLRPATMQSLLEDADENLYKSKLAGRNRVTSAKPHPAKHQEKFDANAQIHSVR